MVARNIFFFTPLCTHRASAPVGDCTICHPLVRHWWPLPKLGKLGSKEFDAIWVKTGRTRLSLINDRTRVKNPPPIMSKMKSKKHQIRLLVITYHLVFNAVYRIGWRGGNNSEARDSILHEKTQKTTNCRMFLTSRTAIMWSYMHQLWRQMSSFSYPVSGKSHSLKSRTTPWAEKAARE